MVKEMFINDGRKELYDIVNRITNGIQDLSYINKEVLEGVLSTLEENVLADIYSNSPEYIDDFKSMVSHQVLKPAGLNLDTSKLSIYFLDNLITCLTSVKSMDDIAIEEYDAVLSSDETPAGILYCLMELSAPVSMMEFYDIVDVSPVLMNFTRKEVRNKLDVVVKYDVETFTKTMQVIAENINLATTLLYRHVMEGKADTLYSTFNDEDIVFIEEELMDRVTQIKAHSGSIDAIIDEIIITNLVYSDVPRVELTKPDRIAKYFDGTQDLEDISLRIFMKITNRSD